jgi:hypothetical protein
MKKALIFVLITIVALALTPAMIYASPKGHEKATGSIEADMGSTQLYAEFNAHEAVGMKPCKGTYHVWGNSGSNALDWYGDITDVIISGNTAIVHGVFASGVDETGSSPIGKPFTLQMTDGGSPGAGNDTFKSGWGSTATYSWTIVSGNLVVHFQPYTEVVSVVSSDDSFGDEVGDVVTITFSSNITKVGDIEAVFSIPPPTCYPIRSYGSKTDWDITGNVLTFTSNAVFTNPRLMTGNTLLSISGLVDMYSNSVVVPTGGVAVQVQ